MMLSGEHSRNSSLRDSVLKKIAFSILSSRHTQTKKQANKQTDKLKTNKLTDKQTDEQTDK